MSRVSCFSPSVLLSLGYLRFCHHLNPGVSLRYGVPRSGPQRWPTGDDSSLWLLWYFVYLAYVYSEAALKYTVREERTYDATRGLWRTRYAYTVHEVVCRARVVREDLLHLDYHVVGAHAVGHLDEIAKECC